MASAATQYLSGASPYAASYALVPPEPGLGGVRVSPNNNNIPASSSSTASSQGTAHGAHSGHSNAATSTGGSPLSPLSSPSVPVSPPSAAVDPAALLGIKAPSPADYGAYLDSLANQPHLHDHTMAAEVLSSPYHQPFATGRPASLAPNGMTRTGSNSSGSGSGGAGGGGAPGGVSGGGMTTRTRAGAALGASAGFVSFDPEQDDPELLLDGDDDDEDGTGGHVEGRPRKRKSVRDLRSAAGQAAGGASGSRSGAANASGDGSGSGGGAGADKDDDKSRRKIQIEYIEEKSKRHITFSKRKAGIMKKAYELSTLTGTQVLLLVVSESGWVYTFTTDKFKPLVKEDASGQLSQGQRLIAACLEAKDGPPDLNAAAYQAVNASSTGNFEANSAVHGGQISLKTGQRAGRPTVTNRRLSSKGRAHIPSSINIGANPMDPALPCPPGSGGIPPLPQLPTPLSAGGYLSQDPMHSPLSPPGMQQQGRSLSHPPISPARGGGGYSLQQQQQQAHHRQQQQQEYNDLMQRTDMLQLQNPYDPSNAPAYEPFSDTDIYTSDLHGLPALPQPPHLAHHSDSSNLPSPVHASHQSQYLGHGGESQHHQQQPQYKLPSQQQQQHHPVLSHSRSFSHSQTHRTRAHGQHRTLHHQASHGHLPSASSASLYHHHASSSSQQQQQQDSPYGRETGADLSATADDSGYFDPHLGRGGSGGGGGGGGAGAGGTSHYSHGRSSSFSGPQVTGIDPGLMNRRTATPSGWSTPTGQTPHDRSRQGSMQGTPVGMSTTPGMNMAAYVGDDGYVR